MVISHAACGGHAPENTLAGIRAALGFGVDGIEIDVQASGDGVPVLMHDLTVDRTTNGRGAVSEMSLAQLRELTAGGELVPTLDEVLALTVGKALLVIEVKQPGVEQNIAEVVRAREALADAMVWSFFPEVLEAMRRVEPRLPSALLIGPSASGGLPKWGRTRERSVSAGLQGVSMIHQAVTDEVARGCQWSGLGLYAWTPDSRKDIARLIELGIDGICTNFPDKAMELLGR